MLGKVKGKKEIHIESVAKKVIKDYAKTFKDLASYDNKEVIITKVKEAVSDTGYYVLDKSANIVDFVKSESDAKKKAEDIGGIYKKIV